MRELIAGLVYECKAELGEGAIWDERLSRLWWVDITKCELHRFDPITKIDEVFEIGTEVGTVVPEEGGDVVLAVRNGFARFDTKTGKLTMLSAVEHQGENVRFNDGKCDPVGRFWAGTMAEGGLPKIGNLYCLNRDLSVSKKIEGVGISNGIGWSPDGDKMYYIDSSSQKVLEYEYDLKDASIKSPRVIVEIDVKEGTPDGMCVDSLEMIWVALWDGGKVLCIDPKSGDRVCEVEVPGVRKVTSCAFGGKNLDTLFITTARQGFDAEDEKNQPMVGSLFSVNVGVRGLPTNLFKVS